jgi:hypothetical protein
VKVVLIAGPSSSGKTTTCKRLSVQLAVNGIQPIGISLDDYFLDREATPRDENGDYDFEHLHALNLQLFNDQLNALFRGEEVELPRYDFQTGKSVMSGKRLVFNQPILEKIIERFKHSVGSQLMHQEAMIDYEIDEYDERFLRHLALGYTKEQITTLRGMPFGVKSLEKRQNDLVQKLFPDSGRSVNATRLVVRALELRIIDIDNLVPDED